MSRCKVSLNYFYPACSTGFQCSNGLCVSNSKICNWLNDCMDGTDEDGCGKDLHVFIQCR